MLDRRRPGWEEYGNASLADLRKADASVATARYVLVKLARWRHYYARDADLAQAGVDRSDQDLMRIQLACYEANAAALADDTTRALSPKRLAENTAAALPSGQMTLS